MPDGVDVSQFQGDLAPEWFTDQGFVIIRAFDRYGDLDRKFAQNWANSEGRCPRGVYGWPIPGANNFVLGQALVAAALGAELGYWADYEHSQLGLASISELEDYLAGIGAQRKGFYSNIPTLPRSPVLDALPWWCANYGPNDGTRNALSLPAPRPWQIHQYTSRGGPDLSGLDRNYAPTLDLWGTDVTYLSRADWDANPPLWPSAGWPDGQPTSYTLHYEGSNVPTDYTRDQYTQIVNAIQRYHQTHGYNDIAYNFVVSPIGDVYEAHGWGERSAAQYDGNPSSIAICYIGGPDTPLTDAAKTAFRSLLDRNPNFPIHPHKHWTPTSCPGAAIEEWIAAGCPAPNVTEPEPAKPKVGEMHLYRNTSTDTWCLWDGFNWQENVPPAHVWNLAVAGVPTGDVPADTLDWLHLVVGQSVEALVQRIAKAS